jgi:hypothetical protein
MGRNAVIAIAYEASLHVLCARSSGPQVYAENEKLVTAIAELDRNGRAAKHVIAFILDLAPGVEPPDAYWRRRFAEQRKGLEAPGVFISIVTTSRVLRGVLTAMNWISPEGPHVKSVHHATWEEAAVWVERMQGTSVVAIRSMFARLPATAQAKTG